MTPPLCTVMFSVEPFSAAFPAAVPESVAAALELALILMSPPLPAVVTAEVMELSVTTPLLGAVMVGAVPVVGLVVAVLPPPLPPVLITAFPSSSSRI